MKQNNSYKISSALIPEKCKYACLKILNRVYVKRLKESYKRIYRNSSKPKILEEHNLDDPYQLRSHIEQESLDPLNPELQRAEFYLIIEEAKEKIKGLRLYSDTIKIYQKRLPFKIHLEPEDYEEMVSRPL